MSEAVAGWERDRIDAGTHYSSDPQGGALADRGDDGFRRRRGSISLSTTRTVRDPLPSGSAPNSTISRATATRSSRGSLIAYLDRLKTCCTMERITKAAAGGRSVTEDIDTGRVVMQMVRFVGRVRTCREPRTRLRQPCCPGRRTSQTSQNCRKGQQVGHGTHGRRRDTQTSAATNRRHMLCHSRCLVGIPT
jgi:hypothetical protein